MVSGHQTTSPQNERGLMLRITRVSRSDAVQTLQLEGKLVGPWVAELRRICAEERNPSGPLRLDLSGVAFVDKDGMRLLRDLAARGFTFAAGSGLVAELLKSLSTFQQD